jgi:predicted NAD/FAD-dependent oxidoreductase
MTLAPKILIVGCGMTGSSIYHYLTRVFNMPVECLTIWEKATEVGGRMRSVSYLGSHCDLGAQYITQTNTEYDNIYSHLVSNNIFNKLAIDIDGMKADARLKNHYVCNQGLSAVIQNLAINANIHTGVSLESFLTLPSGQIEASGLMTSSGSTSSSMKSVVKDAFDIVVITSPTPSVEPFRSSLERIDQVGANEYFDKLSAVRYSSR